MNFKADIFIYKTIIQYLSSSDINTFSCPFVHCTF